MSLLPLIKQLAASPSVNDTTSRPLNHPLVFKLGDQEAIINNNWKRPRLSTNTRGNTSVDV